MIKLGFVGAGNMGSALIRGLIHSGAIAAGDVYVCGHHPEKLAAFSSEMGFHVAATIEELIAQSDAVLFAVKPYHIEEILHEHGARLAGKMVLSVIAGWDHARYMQLLPASARCLCMMPNTPCSVEAGVILFEQTHSLTQGEYTWAEALMSRIAEVVVLPSHLMNAGSAISGCGPAFVAMAMEAMADAAVKHGIPRAAAYRLVSQTMLGTAKMQLATGQHPAVIKDGVCSPHGTTICGVEALERGGMRAAFMDAVDAAIKHE